MRYFLTSLAGLFAAVPALAETPTAHYIFPAGAQRGATVVARVGGCNLHRSPRLIWAGSGVTAPEMLVPTETLWFEGPLIPQPASQQKEDYPRDFLATLAVAADAREGSQTWRLATSQGVTLGWGFVIGHLPEVVETEIDGAAPPVRVELPVTINGRIFPREDIDTWTFRAVAGRVITCRVATAEFGSPLNARLELRDTAGQIVQEALPEGTGTRDLQFTPVTDGEYQLRIHDIESGGLQDHVYRLTVTQGPVLDHVYPLGGRRGEPCVFELHGVNLPASTQSVDLPADGSLHPVVCPGGDAGFGQFAIELDTLPEYRESPSDSAGIAFQTPAILNGRIHAPGEADGWLFSAVKGMEYDLDVRAARLRSPLDPVLQILDSAGQVVAEMDDSPGLQTDARLRWTAPADGFFQVSIRDRLSSRGGPAFAYRVRVMTAAVPEFRLTTSTETLNVERGKSATVKFAVDRGPGFNQPLDLDIEGLPAGVHVSSPARPLTVAENQKEFSVTLTAAADAKVAVAPVRISGRAPGLAPVPIEVRPANPEPGRIAVAGPEGAVWLAVAVPTPFRFAGVFETKFISRGAVFVRKYRIERQGFEGPLEVTLADRQGRHLQGVTARPVVVPAGATEFEFAVTLPPWMEVGRTCRSTLSITGSLTDTDGAVHQVSYSSNDQNNQMIALVDPGKFAIQVPRPTIRALPGHRVELPVRVQRSPELKGPVSVSLVIPAAMTGVSASRLEIPAGTDEGLLRLTFDRAPDGLTVRPVTLRATATDGRGLPVTAEAAVSLIP